MVKLYIKLIQEGRLTIDDVPAKWREKVQAGLQEA